MQLEDGPLHCSLLDKLINECSEDQPKFWGVMKIRVSFTKLKIQQYIGWFGSNHELLVC